MLDLILLFFSSMSVLITIVIIDNHS